MSKGIRAIREAPHAGGQALTELALITPVLVLLILAIVEFAGAFGARTNLQASSAQGARIGALQGNGGVLSCPASGTPDSVDLNVLSAVTSTQGVNTRNISQIQIYKAAPDGTAAVTNTAPYTPLVDTYAIVNGQAISPTLNWPSCIRNPNEPSDSIGVRVTYVYYPILAVPGFSKFTMTDQSVQRLNPTRSALPCPIPGVPINVAAAVASPETSAPSSYDTIAWDPVPGAAGYYVYASVNGAPYQATPVATAGASSSRIQITYPGNTTYAPASYEVSGYNSCGVGEKSLNDGNGQCPLPNPVSILSATALITTPNTDHVTWSSGIASGVYTVTQAVSTSTTQITTAAAPTAEAFPSASSGTTATYRIGEVSACSVVGPTSLPATRVPLPPTPTPTPTATNTNTPTNTTAPTATNTATSPPTSTATNTPVPTATNTPLPGAPTNTPASTATSTPLPTATVTNSPLPTATPTLTSVPIATATGTPTNTPIVPTATPTVDLTTGLVGHWTFDVNGGSGTQINDESGTGHTGTWQSTQGWLSAAGPPFNSTAYAAAFINSRYVSTVCCVSFPNANASQSISLWMYFTGVPTDASGNGNMVALGTTASSSAVQVGFRTPNSGAQLTVWKSGGVPLVQDSVAHTSGYAGSWHNVIYTYNSVSGIHTLYVDGAQVASSTATPQSSAPAKLNFGRWIGGNEFYLGNLDGIRIYTITLTQAQITALQSRE